MPRMTAEAADGCPQVALRVDQEVGGDDDLFTITHTLEDLDVVLAPPTDVDLSDPARAAEWDVAEALAKAYAFEVRIGELTRSDDGVRESYAQSFAQLSTLAGDEFNRGIRAYYFGFAAMTWFVSPQLFIAFTALILLVLWRRDFHSRTLDVLSH